MPAKKAQKTNYYKCRYMGHIYCECLLQIWDQKTWGWSKAAQKSVPSEIQRFELQSGSTPLATSVCLIKLFSSCKHIEPVASQLKKWCQVQTVWECVCLAVAAKKSGFSLEDWAHWALIEWTSQHKRKHFVHDWNSFTLNFIMWQLNKDNEKQESIYCRILCFFVGDE